MAINPENNDPVLVSIESIPGVQISVPSGTNTTEARELAKIRKELLIEEHGSAEAIPTGIYPAQEVVGDPSQARWIPGQHLARGVRRGWDTLTGAYKTIPAGLPSATEEEIVGKQLAREQSLAELERTLGPRVTFHDVMDEFKDRPSAAFPTKPEKTERSFGEAFGTWAMQSIGESLPVMAPGIVGGMTAQRYVPGDILKKIPVIGKKAWAAKGAAFIIGYTTASLPFFFGNNIERKMAEGQLTAEDINSSTALLAAVGQSAADSVLFALLGMYGRTAAATVADTVLKGIAKGSAIGVAEVPTELTQQALERLQAGLPISPADEGALREYIEAGAAALVVGPAVGGTVGGVQTKASQMVDNAKTKVGDPEYDSKVRGEFSIDIPEGRVIAQDEVKERLDTFDDLNSIIVQPQDNVYAGTAAAPKATEKHKFEDIPVDAKIRLWFGQLDQDPETEKTIITPLVDPETGLEVFKDYLAAEFVPSGQTKPSTRLLKNLDLYHGGETYHALWDPAEGVKSKAWIPMGEKPQMRVEAEPRSYLTAMEMALSELARKTPFIRRLFKTEIDPAVVPEGTTKEAYEEQVDARRWLRYITHRGAEWALPQRTLPKDEWAVLNWQKWYNRKQLRLAQGLNTIVQTGIKKAKSPIDEINNKAELQNKAKRDLALYWGGSKDVNLQTLRDMGLSDKAVTSASELRRMVDQGSKDIDKLLGELDPEGKIYSPKLRKTIKQRLGSYMTVAYGLYSDPNWKRPDRLLAMPWEKKIHREAKDFIANNLHANQGWDRDRAPGEAGKQLKRLYRKETSNQALSTIMQEPISDLDPTDLGTGSIPLRPAEGVLQIKQKVPKAIKAAMGEILDPGTRMVLTAFKQGEFISGVTALNELFTLANQPGNRWISKVPSGRFSTPIEGSELNPFAGYYTTEPIAQGLNAAVQSGIYGDAFITSPLKSAPQHTLWNKFYVPLLLKPRVKVAGFKIIWSPQTQLRNVQSGAGFVMVNGHLDSIVSSKMKKSFMTTAAYLKGLTPPEAAELVELGVMNTSAYIGDLARMHELAGNMDSVGGVIEAVNEQQRSITKPFKGKVGEMARKTYQWGDDFWKAMMFYSELEKFTDAFDLEAGPNYRQSEEYKAEVDQNIEIIEELMEGYPLRLTENTPEGRYKEALKQLAAYRTRHNVPNYDYVGSFTDVLRLSPYSNYTAFPTEQIRTSWNTLTSGLKEIEVGNRVKNEARQKLEALNTQEKTLRDQGQFDPAAEETLNEQRKRALRQEKTGEDIGGRGWTRVFSWIGYNSLVGLTLPLIAAWRVGLPLGFTYLMADWVADWAKDHNKIPLEVDPEKGEVSYVDGSYTDAYDVTNKPARTIVRHSIEAVGEGAEWYTGLLEGLVEGMGDFLEPYVEDSIYYAVMKEAGHAVFNPKNNEIFNETDNLRQKGEKLIAFIFRGVEPGYITQGKKIVGAGGEGAEQYDKYNIEKSLTDAYLGTGGLKIETVNFNKIWAKFKLAEYLGRAKSIKAGFSASQYQGGGELLTISDIIESYVTANEAYYDLVLEQRQLIQNSNILTNGGVTLRTLLDGKNLPKNVYKSISKIDRHNLFSQDDTTFVPLTPTDYYTAKKQDLQRELKQKGEKDIRLEMTEFPEEELKKLYLMYAKRPLPGYEWESPPEDTD